MEFKSLYLRPAVYLGLDLYLSTACRVLAHTGIHISLHRTLETVLPSLVTRCMYCTDRPAARSRETR